MERIMLAWALKLELPSHTVRMASGGEFELFGEIYEAEPDVLLGVPESFDAGEEGVGDEAPAIEIVFAPPEDVAAAVLNCMELANSRLRIWVVELDEETGLLTDADQICDMMLNFPKLTFGSEGRRLVLGFVPSAERLFAINTGNVLSPAFHERIWPGEKGLANASGVGRSVAWAVNAPPRGTDSGSGFGAGNFVRAILGNAAR